MVVCLCCKANSSICQLKYWSTQALPARSNQALPDSVCMQGQLKHCQILCVCTIIYFTRDNIEQIGFIVLKLFIQGTILDLQWTRSGCIQDFVPSLQQRDWHRLGRTIRPREKTCVLTVCREHWIRATRLLIPFYRLLLRLGC